jgi:hypothetical protein
MKMTIKTIDTDGCSHGRQVDGEIISDLLAVTPAVSSEGYHTVTHIPSGLAIWTCPYRPYAVRAAEILAQDDRVVTMLAGDDVKIPGDDKTYILNLLKGVINGEI